ncbi:glycosyltransferase family 4 protein [Sedimentitalea sp. XS_ASV28]|uniref:glycosyltransferase family 4 protein n=1 Tax=Sedimentitalea sp. XS_ASV28 TaxID=3241296 RepID=UPI003510E00A
MPRPRVAYLTNNYPKVSHSFIRREILALEAQGVDVLRFALRGWDADLVDEQDIAETHRTRHTLKDGVGALALSALKTMIRQPKPFFTALRAALAMSRHGLRPWPFHLVYLAHACRIQAWLQAEPVPVTHLHAHFGTNPAEIALLIHLLGGPGYSFTVHGMDEVDHARALHFARKVAGAEFAVAISAFSRAQLLRELPPEDWPKVKVVHCGLTADFFAADTPPLPDSPVFLCIGRLSPEKAHLILLDAFARVVRTHPRARLVLAGDGELRPRIEARIADLGLTGAVTITGWISSQQVREEIRHCHVLVQPSFIEGLPVVIMEAMAMRRAVISTYVAGIPELVKPGETGWLVPAGDVDSLAAAMDDSITAGPGRLDEMGIAGQRRARDRHSAETEAARLKALFFGTDP